MGVDHYENFPVASALCPPRLRPPVVAIYRFARTADDLADEGTATPAERLADLASYRVELDAALAGRTPGARWRAVFEPLATQAQRHRLPAQLLHALLDAFEQDARNPTYADREELQQYCTRSANPIGRLLLHLYEVDDARALAQSDDICTALQLINFWQDLGVDARRGRHYVPLADLHRHGLALEDLGALRDSPDVRRLVGELCEWAHATMLAGAPLALTLPGRIGWELRLVVQGGLRVLERIAAIDHATLRRRPQLHAVDVPRLLWRAVRMGRARPMPAARGMQGAAETADLGGHRDRGRTAR